MSPKAILFSLCSLIQAAYMPLACFLPSSRDRTLHALVSDELIPTARRNITRFSSFWPRTPRPAGSLQAISSSAFLTASCWLASGVVAEAGPAGAAVTGSAESGVEVVGTGEAGGGDSKEEPKLFLDFLGVMVSKLAVGRARSGEDSSSPASFGLAAISPCFLSGQSLSNLAICWSLAFGADENSGRWLDRSRKR